MRISTLAMLTLTAMTTQSWNQQANASKPFEPSTGAPTDDSLQAVEVPTAIVSTSAPESSPTQQFAETPASSEPSIDQLPPLVANSSASPEVPVAEQPTPAIDTTRLETTKTPQLFHELEPGYDLPASVYNQPNFVEVPRPLPQAPAISSIVAPPQPTSESIATPVEAITTVPLPASPLPPQELPIEPVVPLKVPTPPLLAQNRRANFSSSGVFEKKVALSSVIALNVTNRTGRTVEIELVGYTRPILLRPGQTRQLRANTRNLSLLYWTPTDPDYENIHLRAGVTQNNRSRLTVELFPSRFASSNLAISYPESDSSRNVLRAF